MTYLTSEQVAQLLKPINPVRVGKDGKGFSHVEAYEIRAHLNRIFGFARWGDTVRSCELVFESSEQRTSKNGKEYTAWTVCYRAVVAVHVCGPDGAVLACWEDGATGEATNQPSRGDAHDLAMKTALSQAMKRAAVNLGDQFGLSLYNRGSVKALVGRVLFGADVVDAEPVEDSGPVDGHITEPLAREDDPAVETRERNDTAPAPVEDTDVFAAAEAFRDTLQAITTTTMSDGERVKAVGGLMKDAQRAGCLGVKVDAGGEMVALKVLCEQALRGRHAA